MPALRRPDTIILAPRSWPSRPGLATKTLILRSSELKSEMRPFFIAAKYLRQCRGDFAHGGVGFSGLEGHGHQVSVPPCSLPKPCQRVFHCCAVSRLAQFLQ